MALVGGNPSAQFLLFFAPRNPARRSSCLLKPRFTAGHRRRTNRIERYSLRDRPHRRLLQAFARDDALFGSRAIPAVPVRVPHPSLQKSTSLALFLAALAEMQFRCPLKFLRGWHAARIENRPSRSWPKHSSNSRSSVQPRTTRCRTASSVPDLLRKALRCVAACSQC